MKLSGRSTIQAVEGGAEMWRALDLLAGATPEQSSGTWTPVDRSGAGLSLAMSKLGTFVRHGRLIMAPVSITWPPSSSTAPAIVGGLPVPCDARNHHLVLMGETTCALTFTGKVIAGTNTMQFYRPGGTAITNADLASTVMDLVAFYFTA